MNEGLEPSVFAAKLIKDAFHNPQLRVAVDEKQLETNVQEFLDRLEVRQVELESLKQALHWGSK